MFTQNTCIYPTCRATALSSFDRDGTITEDCNYCLAHSPDPEGIKAAISQYIRSHDKIIGLNASGLVFTDIDLTDKRFYGCCFQNCSFSTVYAENCRMRMCMFDFSLFADCSLLQSNIQFTSFAGAAFSHILFTGSDLVHNNFCGITSYQSSFDDSDLYNSRFIQAKLTDTSFYNCNIKNTVFYDIEQSNVSFRMSNTREAFFVREEQ